MTDVLSRLSAALADRYRVEREFGQGRMATVYLAHDLGHDRAASQREPPRLAVVGNWIAQLQRKPGAPR